MVCFWVSPLYSTKCVSFGRYFKLGLTGSVDRVYKKKDKIYYNIDRNSYKILKTDVKTDS